MQGKTFRPAVSAVAAALQAPGKVIPNTVRKLSQRAAARVMQWLDDRRERLDTDLLD